MLKFVLIVRKYYIKNFGIKDHVQDTLRVIVCIHCNCNSMYMEACTCEPHTIGISDCLMNVAD